MCSICTDNASRRFYYCAQGFYANSFVFERRVHESAQVSEWLDLQFLSFTEYGIPYSAELTRLEEHLIRLDASTVRFVPAEVFVEVYDLIFSDVQGDVPAVFPGRPVVHSRHALQLSSAEDWIRECLKLRPITILRESADLELKAALRSLAKFAVERGVPRSLSGLIRKADRLSSEEVIINEAIGQFQLFLHSLAAQYKRSSSEERKKIILDVRGFLADVSGDGPEWMHALWPSVIEKLA